MDHERAQTKQLSQKSFICLNMYYLSVVDCFKGYC